MLGFRSSSPSFKTQHPAPNTSNHSVTRNLLGTLTATWGIAGVLLPIGAAMVRLTRVGLDAFDYPLQTHHWAFLVVFLLFMLVSEGYRGFQRASHHELPPGRVNCNSTHVRYRSSSHHWFAWDSSTRRQDGC